MIEVLEEAKQDVPKELLRVADQPLSRRRPNREFRRRRSNSDRHLSPVRFRRRNPSSGSRRSRSKSADRRSVSVGRRHRRRSRSRSQASSVSRGDSRKSRSRSSSVAKRRNNRRSRSLRSNSGRRSYSSRRHRSGSERWDRSPNQHSRRSSSVCSNPPSASPSRGQTPAGISSQTKLFPDNSSMLNGHSSNCEIASGRSRRSRSNSSVSVTHPQDDKATNENDAAIVSPQLTSYSNESEVKLADGGDNPAFNHSQPHKGDDQFEVLQDDVMSDSTNVMSSAVETDIIDSATVDRVPHTISDGFQIADPTWTRVHEGVEADVKCESEYPMVNVSEKSVPSIPTGSPEDDTQRVAHDSTYNKCTEDDQSLISARVDSVDQNKIPEQKAPQPLLLEEKETPLTGCDDVDVGFRTTKPKLTPRKRRDSSSSTHKKRAHTPHKNSEHSVDSHHKSKHKRRSRSHSSRRHPKKSRSKKRDRSTSRGANKTDVTTKRVANIERSDTDEGNKQQRPRSRRSRSRSFRRGSDKNAPSTMRSNRQSSRSRRSVSRGRRSVSKDRRSRSRSRSISRRRIGENRRARDRSSVRRSVSADRRSLSDDRGARRSRGRRSSSRDGRRRRQRFSPADDNRRRRSASRTRRSRSRSRHRGGGRRSRSRSDVGRDYGRSRYRRSRSRSRADRYDGRRRSSRPSRSPVRSRYSTYRC